MQLSFTRTLRLKVKMESYAWLNEAAAEVNQVFNFANEASLGAITRSDSKRNGLAVLIYAQDAVGDWWLCLPVEMQIEQTAAKRDAVGIDLGLKAIATTSDGEALDSGRWTHAYADKLAAAQRRGHKRQSKRIHRKIARCRADSLHKFSRSIVDRYQTIVVGDVSSSRLAKTRMAKSVMDAGWGMLRNMLQYKGEHAGRMVSVVSEKYTSRTCSSCGLLSGPQGVNGLRVRSWTCECGVTHDRDVNAARLILLRGEVPPSVRGNESLQKHRAAEQ